MNNSINKNYLFEQKKQFEDTHHLMIADNHIQHNDDPEYWDILLKEIKNNKSYWKDKYALDFGCGCGRNIKNLLDLAEWKRVDGCDISKKNIEYAKSYINIFYINKTKTWETNGNDLQPCNQNEYDFIMSHIVFQHISDYDVRFSILSDIYKCLKSGGLASLHFMDLSISNHYYENFGKIQNCRVENADYLINDFKKIGFNNVECTIGNDYFINKRSYYIKGYK